MKSPRGRRRHGSCVSPDEERDQAHANSSFHEFHHVANVAHPLLRTARNVKGGVKPDQKAEGSSQRSVQLCRFAWLRSQALSVTYVAGEHRLYLERNCRLPESPAHSRRRNREEPASSKGLEQSARVRPSDRTSAKSRPRSTGFHGSSPCKCQRLSTLWWDRLPPSRPPTKSGARAGGCRLSDRRLHRWLAGTSTSTASSHGMADLLGAESCTHLCEEPGGGTLDHPAAGRSV